MGRLSAAARLGERGRDISNRVGTGYMGDAVSHLAAPTRADVRWGRKLTGWVGKVRGVLGVVGLVIAMSHALLAMLVTFYALQPDPHEWGMIIIAIAWAVAVLSVAGYGLGMWEREKMKDRMDAIELHCKTKFGENDDEVDKIKNSGNETKRDMRNPIDKVNGGTSMSKAAV